MSTGVNMLDVIRDRIVIINRAGRVVFTNAAARGDFSGELSALLAHTKLRDAIQQVISGRSQGTVPVRVALDPALPDEWIEATVVRAPNQQDAVVAVHPRQQAASVGTVGADTVAELFRQHVLDMLRQFVEGAAGSLDQSEPLSPAAVENGRQVVARLERVIDMVSVFGNDALVADERLLPGPLIEEVCKQLTPLARARRARLAMTGLDADLPPVYGSGRWLQRAIREIVDNALRHGDGDAVGGGAVIEIAARQTGAFLQLSFRNQGGASIGAPAGGRFVPFAAEAGKPAAAPHAGMRIGLPLAQRIVEMHGGTLRVRTPADGGTEIDVQLPTGAPHYDAHRIDIAQAQKYAEDLARLLASRRKSRKGDSTTAEPAIPA